MGTVFAKLCNVALCRPTVKVLCFLPVVVYFILFYLETLFLPGDFILTWGYYSYLMFSIFSFVMTYFRIISCCMYTCSGSFSTTSDLGNAGLS